MPVQWIACHATGLHLRHLLGVEVPGIRQLLRHHLPGQPGTPWMIQPTV